jgi:hypothetical protein
MNLRRIKMPIQTRALIISRCKDCGGFIEAAFDLSGEDGFWEEPRIGSSINGLPITNVTNIVVKNSLYPGYLVELDTRLAPHCLAAKQRSS